MLCGAAQSSDMLIIGRAVAGIGASGLSNGALTIIGASAPTTKRPGELCCATSVHPQAVLTADVVLMGISMAGE